MPAASANAGAWLQKPEQTQLILNYRYLSTESSYDFSGAKTKATNFSKSELSPYVEYGLDADWTIGGALSLQSSSKNGIGGDVTALDKYKAASAEIFARTALFKGENYIISIEPRLKAAIDDSDDVNPEGSAPIPELKISYGQAFDSYKKNHKPNDSFADISLTYRMRNADEIADMFKLNLINGSRPFNKWEYLRPLLFLTSATYEKSLTTYRAGENAGNYDLVRLEASAIYEYDDGISFGAGYFDNIYGLNTAAGRGILLTTWVNF